MKYAGHELMKTKFQASALFIFLKYGHIATLLGQKKKTAGGMQQHMAVLLPQL